MYNTNFFLLHNLNYFELKHTILCSFSLVVCANNDLKMIFDMKIVCIIVIKNHCMGHDHYDSIFAGYIIIICIHNYISYQINNIIQIVFK